MHPTPDESFIPLTPKTLSANERPDLRVTVVSQANAQPLPALEQRGSWSSISQGSANEPRVTLQRDGDHVSAIRIQCACGRIVELACACENAPAHESAPPSDPVTGSKSTMASPHESASPAQPVAGADSAPGTEAEPKGESAQKPKAAPKSTAAPAKADGK